VWDLLRDKSSHHCAFEQDTEPLVTSRSTYCMVIHMLHFTKHSSVGRNRYQFNQYWCTHWCWENHLWFQYWSMCMLWLFCSVCTIY